MAEALMTARIETEPSFTAANPEKLFEGQGQYAYEFWGRSYDVAPDGQYFYMERQGAGVADQGELYVVLNWFEELKRLVPND